jgi:hypothetical protein
MPKPHPIGVENVVLAVLSNLPDVPVAVVFFELLRQSSHCRADP